MIVRDLAAADAALLQQLVEDHRFKPYRHHRYLTRRQQNAVLQEEIARLREARSSVCVIAGDGRQDTTVVTARALAWDSEFFGVPMARIEHVLRGASASRDSLRSAVSETLDRLRRSGVLHVTCKVDVADFELVHALAQHAFVLMDAIVTFVAHPRRPAPRPPKAIGRVRPFQPADTDTILAITSEAYRGYRGRFQLDPHLPIDRGDAFYVQWARACCSGAMADRIVVAEDAGGRIIGWASVKRAEPVSSLTGAPISVGSLGACRDDSPGAYARLICAAAVENHAAGILTEAMTQNSNFAMVRVLEAVGAQYARAEYTFHGWLGA